MALGPRWPYGPRSKGGRIQRSKLVHLTINGLKFLVNQIIRYDNVRVVWIYIQPFSLKFSVEKIEKD